MRFDSEGPVLISTFPEFTLLNVYFPSGSNGPERVAYKLAFYTCLLNTVGFPVPGLWGSSIWSTMAATSSCTGWGRKTRGRSHTAIS